MKKALLTLTLLAGTGSNAYAQQPTDFIPPNSASSIVNSSGGNVVLGGISANHGIICYNLGNDYTNLIDGGFDGAFANSILGGGDNWINGGGNVNGIVSGAHNSIGGIFTEEVWHSIIGGGSCNRIGSNDSRVDYSSILTGSQNLISDKLATITGGIRNEILYRGQGSLIGNGRDHSIAGGNHWAVDTFIGGGARHKVAKNRNANYSATVGGTDSLLDHSRAVLLGGNGLISVKANTTHVEHLYIKDAPAFRNAQEATVPDGVVWKTSDDNTMSLPAGVLMIK